ncbi:helix-turn-helix transcriptional regulator [Planctomycetales bacterium ZRK34]|nr:helix-turn-helix transcriptional regulator [Planctomycetales bacterium ZRK34]
MLSKTLAQLIERKLTTAREIGELTGVAPSTVYRWIRGESEPDFNAVRLLVRHLHSADCVEAILAAFTAGSAWRFYSLEAELDVNADGQINVDDALDSTISAVRSASRSLSAVRKASLDGVIDTEESIELVALLNDVIRQCSITQQVLVHMSEARSRRKLKLTK